jgi:SRSO17 transposase
VELWLQQRLEKTILRVFRTVTEDHLRRIVRMTLKQIAALGKKLVTFLGLFADCFGRREARDLLRVYVKGQLSDVHRKTAEAIALRFGKAPRTLQRFLESVKWDEEKLRDRCQQIVAQDHAHPEAIGVVDESGVGKSGSDTVGVGRQWNGSRGKVDNCVVGVHLSYATPGFQCLLDSGLYLPKDWANDPVRRKKTTFPTRWSFARNLRSPWS